VPESEKRTAHAPAAARPQPLEPTRVAVVVAGLGSAGVGLFFIMAGGPGADDVVLLVGGLFMALWSWFDPASETPAPD
jgi:hypothetical protein